MKRQFPGNINNERCDPRFSGGRGRGRRVLPSQGHNFSSTASAGGGRGGPHQGGLPRMNVGGGGRGRGRPINLPPATRGPSQQIFGRGGYQRNHQHQPPPPPPPPQNNHNNFIITNRFEQINTGRGRGRGGNVEPGRDPFGGRYNFRSGEQQQQGIPIGPPRGRGFGRGIHRLPPPPPPPSPSSNLPWQGTQLASTQSNQQGIGVGTSTVNRNVLIQNSRPPQPRQASHHHQQQQYQPTKHIPFQQLQSQQQQQKQLSVTLNNNNNNSIYTGYQQNLSNVANTSNLVNQQQFQTNNTVTRNNTMQQQLHQKQVPVASTIATTTMTQSSIPTTTVANSKAKNSTVQEIGEAWKEYTAPGGVKYYHNALLKESTYHKPDVLRKKEQANNSDHTKNSSSQKRAWQEHQDANTGKFYYSDGVSTTWEKPVDYISPDTIVANTSLASEREERNNRKLPLKKKKRSSTAASSLSAGKINDNTDKGDSFANKKEAITAFKGLLLAKAISPTLKWNEVIKSCQSDSRWEPLEEVLSMGERKQALAEYQTKRTNEIRNDQRQERVRAKEAFGQLLVDVLPPVSGFSARSSRFIDVRKALSKDDRFYAVENEATRESLFLDFCDEYKKRQERKKRSRKWEAQDSFKSFLQEIEEGGTLTYASTWESFLVSLPEKDKADSRFATSVLLSNSDRQLHFADFVIELQKLEDDKRRRIRDARCRAEKAQRDKYRELLHQMAVVGKIFPSSRWREIEGLLLKDDAFKMVEGQNRDSPRELFETFVDKWDLMYRRERSFLCRLLHSPGKLEVVISAGTTYDSFKNSITNQASYSSEIQNETFRIINKDDPVSSACLLHNELTARSIDNTRSVDNKPYKGSRRGSTRDDSSEDEGEIVEDRELKDDDVGELQ
eukprot:CAMPEP_0170878998 /NCGR_PEP_ID=MMETSP0734-20130129/31404_1 /TAXON_ID=186038 /ORGANISM="Fragilariopsis kerguelensis, Strain L26-C5" /LENGTH=894 /DNA_ID=CAMNT_0011261899 /DNA_START=1 /DNA_END=2685 /DNA_ORIENTATION=-